MKLSLILSVKFLPKSHFDLLNNNGSIENNI